MRSFHLPLHFWLCAIVTVSSLPLVALAQGFLPGDLNGDGRVTDLDLTLLNRYLQGSQALSDQQIIAADVNSDGQITAADLQQLQRSGRVAAAPLNSQVSLDSAYSGQVVDRQTGRPLSNVEVAVPGAGISVRTDAQGRFQLPSTVPSDQILVAKLENYLPYSRTTDQSQPLQVELDRWDQNATLVLESNVVHLGDDAYSPDSAGASQFRLRTQGRELTRPFQLEHIPSSPLTLKIGSLIGLDTPEAVRAGQSNVAEADMTPLVILLNGQQIQTVTISGNNITIPLPPANLQLGQNTVTLQTGKTYHPSYAQRGSQVPLNIPIFGGSLTIGIPVGSGNVPNRADYDDIELANVVVELPHP